MPGEPALQGPPVLSTPDTNIFDVPAPQIDLKRLERLSDEQLHSLYEIERTVYEIRSGRWQRIALQFPDSNLVDAPRVYKALSRELKQAPRLATNDAKLRDLSNSHEDGNGNVPAGQSTELLCESDHLEETLFILGDTSYGACCVDEIAAQHGNADVVVHYGRSCLSPTARLPVIYCFTKPPLNTFAVAEAIKNSYDNQNEKIILMADVPYISYIPQVADHLKQSGYTNFFATSILHDTSSPLPNRTIPPDVQADEHKIIEYHLFHIADPPDSLLLTLSSRLASIRVYPTADLPKEASSKPTSLLTTSTASRLSRRYALVTSVSTAPVLGILINTLSVQNYLHVAEHVRAQIAAAGKKSYTFVVGKVNAAKIANFSEVAAWVVIGCWESSLLESKDFWKPVVTPFELQLALQGDQQRVWTGRWASDFRTVLDDAASNTNSAGNAVASVNEQFAEEKESVDAGRSDTDDDESAPPEFDLRTGRYVSHSRPMQTAAAHQRALPPQVSQSDGVQALARRAKLEVATVGGMVSPGAEFLLSGRTWQGLGSDFGAGAMGENGDRGTENGAVVEQGRSGIARGYVVGESMTKR